jgi:hypothetical protein
MTRLLTLVTLITVAGCGAAPSGESTAAIDNNAINNPAIGCGSDYFAVDVKLGVGTSTVDPWGSQTGTVVIYGADPNLVIYGWNDTTKAVAWFMNGGTDADVTNFESYPQSRRFCGGGTDNPGGGSGKGPPDPRWLGQCAPNTLPSPDAFDSYWYGPYGTGNKWPIGNNWCSHYGEGGCVPQSCSALHLGCGWQTNNCGRSVYCGYCPPPPPPPNGCECGGTYPHCRLCI